MEWRVDADDRRSVSVAHGVIPVQWVEGEDAETSGGAGGVRISTLHPQLVPEIAREAKRLLASGQQSTRFVLPAAALGLQAVAGTSDSNDLYCSLTSSPTSQRPEPQGSSWLDLKLQRAEFHRQRGNDRFKRDAVTSAVRAYEKALQWLACPSDPPCAFSPDERERVDAIAVPCHANLATCHWKREEMDACIVHATRALQLDATHVKARYRRSQAYLRTKQFDEAIADLEGVAAAEPESKLFATGLAKAKLARQQHRAKQKHALASAFRG